MAIEAMRTQLAKDDRIEINKLGGKQTYIEEWPTELPPWALLEVSKVMCEGAKKYGCYNWHSISVKSEMDHALRHAFQYLALKDVSKDDAFEELAHFATRALMALDQRARELRGLVEV